MQSENSRAVRSAHRLWIFVSSASVLNEHKGSSLKEPVFGQIHRTDLVDAGKTRHNRRGPADACAEIHNGSLYPAKFLLDKNQPIAE